MSETNSGIDLGVSAPDIAARMSAFIEKDEQARAEEDEGSPPQDAAPQDAPQDQAQEDGLSPDDIQDEAADAPSPGEQAFEIVVDGQTHKIESRADQIKYMQQGFHYTQEMQKLRQKEGSVDQYLQRAAQVEQMMPVVAQELATVKAIESQLQQYAKVDWVGLASNPETVLEYPKIRAQYDQLMQAYQGAANAYQQKAQAVFYERSNLHAQKLAQEAEILRERIPDWRDQAKYQAGVQDVRNYLIKQGADAAAVDALDSAIAVDIARKAMLYDRLKSLKADKSKQLRTVPPVPKPGASSTPRAENEVKAREAHRRHGTRDSAVGLLLTRLGGG